MTSLPQRLRNLGFALAVGTAIPLAATGQTTRPAVPGNVAIASGQRLGHEGRWITDGQGRVVILRGVNMVNKFPPYTLSAAGFGEEDAAILAAEGFTGVRVGVIYSAVEPTPGNYDDRYLDDIEKTVAMLAQRGIWSLVDFHQDLYGPVFHGEGLPEWATQTDGLPTGPSHGFPQDYAELPAVARAFDNFWANKPGPGGIGLQDRYAAAWGHVAARFARTPGVLGYDLMNEPFPGSMWKECNALGCGDFDQRLLTPLWRKAITAIRKGDPDTLIFYEPNVILDMASATHVPRLDDLHLGFSFHPYVSMARGLGLAEQHSIANGVALLASEWGATTDVAAIRVAAKEMDRNMMSWLYWTWANKTPFNIPGIGQLPSGAENQGLVQDLGKPRTPGNLHIDRLEALTGPYPRAVAGLPHQFSYDHQSRVFDLSYRTSAAGNRALADQAQTEIFCPERHYPEGCKAVVTGAVLVSAAGDRMLRLANQPGATVVTVRVAPAQP